MGNQQNYGKSVETFLLKYLPQLNYKLTLNDTLLYYTILSTLEDEGPIVCKLHFSKIDDELFNYYEGEINKIRAAFDIYKHPNVLPCDKIFNIQKKAILGVRQFVCHNLKEKLHRIPKLSTMEKKWLAFQILCALSQIHSVKMVHGDIKPSNIMITSFNQLLLTDQIPIKPAYICEDDLKTYNLYFGELDNNQKCYIAPERFSPSISEATFDNNALDPSMDIFSAGCVIAEIFLDRKDGRALFDLAQLQNYKKGVYDPRDDLMKQIKDEKIVDLIMSMISPDPSERSSINEYIIMWNKEVLPAVFSQVFYQINSTFVRNQFIFSDLKMGLIRKYINSIWFSCFGKRNAIVTEQFNEPIEPFVFERLRDDTIKQYEAYLVPSNELFVFLSEDNLEIMYQQMPIDMKVTNDDRESIIVVVHWIGVFITSCFYPQSRCSGLEMLLKIGNESSMDIRLQFILPYILQLFDDENSKVKAKAIEAAVYIFKDIMDQAYLTTLTATDFKVFDNYILPAFIRLKNENAKDSYVQHVFVSCLPLLAQIGHRFLELSIGSRFQRHYRHKNQMPHQNEEQKRDESLVSSSGARDSFGDDDDNTSDRLFQQSEYLVASTQHHYQSRATIVIKDSGANEHSGVNPRHHDNQEVFINYDTEYDKLRRTILGIINDLSSHADPTIQRILYQNMGNFAVFFGRKLTIDNLIPLQTSCFNNKDFLLEIECLRGIPYLGLRVGQLTLSQFLLITCTHLLQDSQEIVVYEMIDMLNKLLKFGLLSKEDSLENFRSLLPHMMHANTWIREAVGDYIAYLSDPVNKILTSAEVYCLIRPEVKKYKKLGPIPQRLLVRPKLDRKDEQMSFQSILDHTQRYRIIQSTVVSQLSGVSFGQIQVVMAQNAKRGRKRDSTDIAYEFIDKLKQSHEYIDNNFNGFNAVAQKDIHKSNHGLNSRILTNNYQVNFETDMILQALNIVPDDPEIPIISYKNPNYFTNLSMQGLQIGSLLSLELSNELPQQQPQYQQHTKIVQLAVNQSSRDYYQIGQPKTKFNKWRPSGRLITTLYEHKNAVNCLAITDDSQFFITGSKLDSQVKIWLTKDIEGDVTSHSHLQVKSKRQINQIATIDNSNHFAIAGSQGSIDIYQMSRVEQEASTSASSEPNEVTILKTIEKKDEGDIMLCSSMILPVSHQHLLAYVTQRGSLYLHDMRTRYDVSSDYELFGCQKGLPTCMTFGNDPYSMYFGTLGGYVMIYDARYNTLAAQYKHYTRSPINSLSCFHPTKNMGNLNLNKSDASSPLVLISAGGPNYELSLVNLETSTVEVLLTIDDRKNKDNLLGSLPVVPSYYRESVYQESDLNSVIKKNETNSSLFRRYLQSHTNSAHFNKLISEQQQGLVRNLDEEWLKNSKNRYMMVKNAFESGNSCRKVLVPRCSNNLLDNSDTVPYAITGGNDKKLRFWDFTNLKKKSYCINSPNDDEAQYNEEYQGETLVIQEKVQLFKTFPPVNAQLASRQFDITPQTNPNTQYYHNSTYYSIIGNILNGAGNMNADGTMMQPAAATNGTQILKNNFQMEKIGDQELVYNFNGLSEWQHFNGVTMNQGCGAIGASEQPSAKIDYHYRDSQIVSHQDCILEMGMLELSSHDPVLITCGRDGLVKLWK